MSAAPTVDGGARLCASYYSSKARILVTLPCEIGSMRDVVISPLREESQTWQLQSMICRLQQSILLGGERLCWRSYSSEVRTVCSTLTIRRMMRVAVLSLRRDAEVAQHLCNMVSLLHLKISRRRRGCYVRAISAPRLGLHSRIIM